MRVHINLANKQTKQNKTARERRKERKKKKQKQGGQNVIFKTMAPRSEAGAKLRVSLWAFLLLRGPCYTKGGVEGGGVYLGSGPESLISRRDISILYLNVGSIPSMFV